MIEATAEANDKLKSVGHCAPCFHCFWASPSYM